MVSAARTRDVPLLVTVDLEVARDHDPLEQEQALERIRAQHGKRKVPLTIFATAEAGERFAAPLRRLLDDGHELGCHGIDHSRDEDWRRASPSLARDWLAESTSRLEAATGRRPRVFRGPRMETSRATQAALVEAGYEGDFSVASRRMDLITCRGATLAGVFAPRGVYRPSSASPFRRGELPLVVVPLSAFGVPLVSGVLYLAGHSFTAALFRGLKAEARRAGGPIVYLFHSYELAHFTGDGGTGRRPWHQRLYARDPEARWRRHLRLLEAMMNAGDMRPMLATPFVRSWAASHGLAVPSPSEVP